MTIQTQNFSSEANEICSSLSARMSLAPQLKILLTVVICFTVFVMDGFGWKQWPPYQPRYHQSMFGDPTVSSSHGVSWRKREHVASVILIKRDAVAVSDSKLSQSMLVPSTNKSTWKPVEFIQFYIVHIGGLSLVTTAAFAISSRDFPAYWRSTSPMVSVAESLILKTERFTATARAEIANAWRFWFARADAHMVPSQVGRSGVNRIFTAPAGAWFSFYVWNDLSSIVSMNVFSWIANKLPVPSAIRNRRSFAATAHAESVRVRNLVWSWSLTFWSHDISIVRNT